MSLAHIEHCDADLGGATPDCPGCRCEHALARALDRELAPQPGDDDRLARAIAFAMLPGAPPPVASSATTTNASIGWTWIAAGVVAVVAVVAVIAARPDEHASEVAQIDPATVEAPTIASEPIEPKSIEPKSIEPITPSIVVPAEQAPVAPRPRAKPTRPAPPTATAAELFARATKARRAGERSDAIALYRELQVAFADSREATVATVALGRLLLDADDAKSALAAFERYLTRAPNGTLAEEALVGKATALGRLGRARDEAAAWRTLIERFPESAARSRAQSRLDAIGP